MEIPAALSSSGSMPQEHPERGYSVRLLGEVRPKANSRVLPGDRMPAVLKGGPQGPSSGRSDRRVS